MDQYVCCVCITALYNEVKPVDDTADTHLYSTIYITKIVQ